MWSAYLLSVLEHQWMSAGSLAVPFIPVLCSHTEIIRISSPLCPAPSTSCAFLYSVMVQLHTAPGHCQLLYSSNAATARVQRSRSSGGMLFPCSALLNYTLKVMKSFLRGRLLLTQDLLLWRFTLTRRSRIQSCP